MCARLHHFNLDEHTDPMEFARIFASSPERALCFYTKGELRLQLFRGLSQQRCSKSREQLSHSVCRAASAILRLTCAFHFRLMRACALTRFVLLTFLMHNRNEQGCPPSNAHSTSKRSWVFKTTQAQSHLSPTLSTRTQVKAHTVDLRDGNADQATKTRLA